MRVASVCMPASAPAAFGVREGGPCSPAPGAGAAGAATTVPGAIAEVSCGTCGGGAGRDSARSGGNAHIAAALASADQVIDLKHARLQARRLDVDSAAVDLVLVAVDLAYRVERLSQADVLQIHRDGSGHIRGHQHAVARARHDRQEYFACRCVVHVQIEARLDRLSLRLQAIPCAAAAAGPGLPHRVLSVSRAARLCPVRRSSGHRRAAWCAWAPARSQRQSMRLRARLQSARRCTEFSWTFHHFLRFSSDAGRGGSLLQRRI